MPALKTWAGRSNFSFTGTLTAGTTITYGSGSTTDVTPAQFAALFAAFPAGMVVEVGTSRTTAPAGSLGAWLQGNVTKTATASYVAPILLHFGRARRVAGNPSQIEFV